MINRPNFRTRHYEIIAKLIKNLPFSIADKNILIEHFAPIFTSDNPNFLLNLFREAVYGHPSGKPQTSNIWQDYCGCVFDKELKVKITYCPQHTEII